jgi:hypothetical protein
MREKAVKTELWVEKDNFGTANSLFTNTKVSILGMDIYKNSILRCKIRVALKLLLVIKHNQWNYSSN